MHYSCLHIWFLWTYFQMTPAMLILSLASLIFPDLSQVCYDPTNNTWPNSLYIYAIDSFSSWIYFTCVCFHWILLCYFPLFLQSDKIITSPEHTGWNRTCLWLFSFFFNMMKCTESNICHGRFLMGRLSDNIHWQYRLFHYKTYFFILI